MRDGLKDWLKGVRLPEFREKDVAILSDSLLEEQPTPIVGMENVWCVSGLAGEKLALVHIIKTSAEINNPQSAIRDPQSKDVS